MKPYLVGDSAQPGKLISEILTTGLHKHVQALKYNHRNLHHQVYTRYLTAPFPEERWTLGVGIALVIGPG